MRQDVEQLSRSQGLFEAVTDSTGMIISAVDTEFRYTFFNKRHHEEMKRLTGRSTHLGMSLMEMFADMPEQRDIALALWGRALDGETLVQTTHLGDPRGYHRVYRTRHAPILDDSGSVVGAGEVTADITEEARLQKALEVGEAQARGANRILENAISARTEEELGEVCLTIAEELTQSQFGFIGELAADGTLTDFAVSNPGWDACEKLDLEGHRRPPRQSGTTGIYGHVLASGRPYFCNDPLSDPHGVGLPKGHPPLTAFLGVPLKRGAEVVGMVAVANREGGYDPTQAKVLESLAVVVEAAIERFRAEDAVREEEARMSATNRILEAALVAESEESLGTTVLAILQEVTGSGLGFIGVVEPDDGLRTVAATLPEADERDLGRKVRAGEPSAHGAADLYRRVFESREACVVNDIGSGSRPVTRPRGHPALRSFLGVPLWREGTVVGAIALANRPGGYEQRHLRLLESVAPAVETSLERRRAADELKVANQLVGAHLENSPVAVIGFDAEFRVTRWSQEAEHLFGWSAAEAVGRTVAELDWVYEEDAPLVEAELAALTDGTRPRSRDVNRNHRKDRSVIWCEWYNSAIYDSRGRLESVFSLVLDVTGRVRAEEALRASEAQARDLVRYAPTGIYEVQFDPPRFLSVNDAMCDLSGYSREELLAKNPFDLLDVESRTRFRERLGSLVAGKRIPENVEYTVIKKDGREIFVVLDVRFTADDDGRVRTALVIGHDVTERRRLEEAQRSSLDRMRVLQEVASAVGASLNRRQLSRKVLDLSQKLLGANMGGVCLVDVVSGSSAFIADFGLPEVRETALDLSVTGNSLLGRAALRNEVQTADEGTSPSSSRQTEDGAEPEPQRWVAVPVREGDVVVGVLSLGFCGSREFTAEEMDLYQAVADQMSVGFENARLFEAELEAEQQATQELETTSLLLRSATVIAEAPDLSAGVHELLREMQRALPGVRSVVYALDAPLRELEVVAAIGEPAPEPETRVPLSEMTAAAEEILLTGKSQVLDFDAMAAEDRGIGELLGVHLLQAVPLMFRGTAVGVALVDYPEEPRRQLLRQQVKVVEAFGAQAAAAIQNALLFQAERRAASTHRLLARVASLLSASAEVDEALPAVLALVGEHLGATGVAIAVADDGEWSVDHAWGTHERMKGTRQRLDELPSRFRVLETKSAVFVPDVAASPNVNLTFASEVRARALALFPMVFRGEVVGTIDFVFDRPRDFVEEAKAFMSRVAYVISAALENTRLFNAERRSARMASALNSINETLMSAATMDEMLDRIVNETTRAVGADKAIVADVAGTDLVIRQVAGFPAELVDRRFPLDDFPEVARAVRERTVVFVEDALTNTGSNQTFARAHGDGAFMTLPLANDGQVFGALSYVYNEPRRFDAQDAQFGQRLSVALALALESVRLYETERTIAETLQETLVVVPSHVAGVSFSRAYESATIELGQVGGDFVDIFDIHGPDVGIAIGDVSGKGIDAAVITSLVRNTIRAHALDGLPPSDVCTKTNGVVQRFTDADAYVTVFFGVLDTRTGLLRYVSAGHPPALVLADDEVSETPATKNPILGAFDAVRFHDAQAVVRRGERLVLYTDGVIEARSRQSDEFFGVERLRAALRSHANVDTARLADALMQDVVDFSQAVLRDDAAILAIEPTDVELTVTD